MARTRQQVVSRELRRLAERLEAYRKRSPRRRRLPEGIWNAAVALAGRHGVNPVARALGLDYYSLKQRVEDRPAVSDRSGRRRGAGPDGPVAGSPGFVEVCVGKPAPGVGWTVEFQDGAGRRMTMRLPDGKDVDVVALAEAFWGRLG